MKVCFVANDLVKFPKFYNNESAPIRLLFYVTVAPATKLDSCQEESFNHLKTSLMESGNTRVYLDMEPASEQSESFVKVTLRNPMLAQLCDLLHPVQESPIPKLQVIITPCGKNGAGTDGSGNIVIKDFKAEEAEYTYSTCINVDDIPELPHVGKKGYLKIRINVDVADYVHLKDLPPCDEKYVKLYAGRKSCDFHLVSENGTKFPCHKDFLCVSSTFFSASLDGNFRKASDHELLVPEMSDEAIEALLEYIYCNKIDKPYSNFQITFELLKASHYYDMETLWKILTRILKAKSFAWFDVETSFKLFGAIIKMTDKAGSEVIKEKILRVLSARKEELDNLPIFLETFTTKTAQDMFKAMLVRPSTL